MNYEAAYSRAVRYAAVRSPEDLAGFIRHLKKASTEVWTNPVDQEIGRLRDYHTSLGAFADFLAEVDDPREAVVRAAGDRVSDHLAGRRHWSYPPVGLSLNHRQVREVPLVGARSELRLCPLVKAGDRKAYPHTMSVGVTFAHPDQTVEPMRYNTLYLAGEMHPDETRTLIDRLADAGVVEPVHQQRVHAYLDSHYNKKKV